ncbi:MAG: MmgE/PrpD family protein [Peptococcaceae bacterium]|jgi:2-methylcitrate dehydratase PrpD|nr:MmgE/PrpD family protein [Peptococcaceae bacterium]
MSLARQVSEFIQKTTFASLSPAVVHKAKNHIMDTLGVCIASAGDPTLANIAKSFLEDIGSGSKCTVFGLGAKASISDAALLNGLLTHGLDYDDSSWTLIGHPSAAVLPAAIAVGESVNCSGKDLITAYVIGVEVACKIGTSGEPYLYEAGWHATGVVGVLGAAAAAGKLLNLSTEQLVNAIGIAASLAGGLRRNFGTFTKPFHAGAACQNGVIAALLAKRGFDANEEALEGKYGFFENYTQKKAAGGFPNPGQPFDIDDPGFFVKPYPSCAATHTGIDAVLELRQAGIDPEKIQKIEAGCGPVGPIMLIYDQPSRGFEGKFCMKYLIAAALVDGKVGLNTFTDEKIANPLIKKLMNLTTFEPTPEFADRPISEAPTSIKITLQDGTILAKTVEDPLGSPTNPMNQQLMTDKFKDATSNLLSAEKAAAAITLLSKLEDVPAIQALINILKAE